MTIHVDSKEVNDQILKLRLPVGRLSGTPPRVVPGSVMVTHISVFVRKQRKNWTTGGLDKVFRPRLHLF